MLQNYKMSAYFNISTTSSDELKVAYLNTSNSSCLQVTWADVAFLCCYNALKKLGSNDLLSKSMAKAPKLEALVKKVAEVPKIAEYINNKKKE